MKPLTQQTTVTPEQAGRADRVVQALVGGSRAQVTGLFHAGCVSINGTPCAEAFGRVAAGDVVEVRREAQRKYRPAARPWRDSAFRIVFEDEHLIVVDKAAWVLSVPAAKGSQVNLVDRLNRYLSRGGRADQAWVVHRLDQGTSGLLVFGKSKKTAEALKAEFAARKPRREYLAIVTGLVEGVQGRFESHLATGTNLDRYSTPDPAKGELAITHYRVRRRLGDATVVRCWLETGKRNQIRVHFAEAGHPVLGDPRYQPKLARHPRWKARRLALHAAVLGFMHPATGKEVVFNLAPPREFAAFLRE